MWININTLFFLHTNKHLIAWKDVYMIWRQYIYASQKQLDRFNYSLDNRYSENLRMELWAKNIKSVDWSNYEKADYIHDINYPIGDDLTNVSDIIFDGWSTEHMFNPAQALINYHNMIKIDWYYIWVLPCNNRCNHGFYQFSPDLFYRFFSTENWYKTKIFISDDHKWGYIRDLINLKQVNNTSIQFSNSPCLLYIVAQKIKKKEIVNPYPIQSIYIQELRKTSIDNSTSLQKETRLEKVSRRIKLILPQNLKQYIYIKIKNREIIKIIEKPHFNIDY